jgi:hypothetical protein
MAKAKICSIVGCGKKILGRGWCSAHYQRWWRYGAPLGGRPNRLAWLENHKDYIGRDCLMYPFTMAWDGRAGQLVFRGKIMGASRIMCHLAHGDPPAGKRLATHICGNGDKGCVNPQHLRWASHKQNSADRISHGTDNRGEKNWNTKLTRRQVLAIRRLIIKQKVSFAKIGQRFGVSKTTVQGIIYRQTWAWLP